MLYQRCGYSQFQHTAARRRLGECDDFIHEVDEVSTHSRPKAAGFADAVCVGNGGFQHTAARRRLVFCRLKRINLQ